MPNKREIMILPCVLLTVVLLSIFIHFLMPGLHPTEQPGTTWSTKDGTIVFFVPDKDAPLGTVPYGTVKTDNGIIDVVFAMSNLAGGVDVYTPEDYTMLQNKEIAFPVEFWTEVSVQTDCFVVRVISTIYFEEGQEIVFFKVG